MLKKLFVISLGLIFILNCGGPDKEPSGYWESANALTAAENYAGAIDQYNKIVNFYPSDTLAAAALFRMCEIKRSKQNKYQEAIQLYKQYIEKYPENGNTPNAMFMIGYIYANDIQNYTKAKAAYNNFIESYPNHELVASAKWEVEHMGKDIHNVVQNDNIPESN